MIEDKSILAYSGLTYYDERIKDYIDNTVGGSALHPGSHILIDSANTISAVYDSSDFDISGLTDSQNLRETWNNKQDKLIPGPGVEIDSSNTITVITSSVTEIDDTITSSTKTWSSEKISGELEEISYTVASHIVEIEDDISGLTEELAGKSNTGHTHEQYSLTSHTHSEYSLTSHTHDQYSLTSHTHTAAEVGALPADTTIPSKTSDLTNDSGFVTGATTYSAGTNIEITGTGNSINALGYVYDATKFSFATGLNTTASGNYSHAEGSGSEATNEFSHAEGNGVHATGPASHAEGSATWANGNNSHAEGIGTIANGWCSHTEGDGTETSDANSCEHAEGRFNASHTGETDAQKTRHSIGIGSDPSHRANAFEVMANGDVYINGVGGYDGTNPASAQTVSQAIPTKTSDLTNDSGFITGYTETDPTVPSWAKQPDKPSYTAEEVGALPSSTTIPSKTSDLTNDSGFITGYTETDPTVPAWAKAANKPSYTAAEVGALSSATTIPSKTSDLTNDSGFITGYTESDPTVPAWAKQPNKPTYTAQEVGALSSATTIPSKTSDLTNDSGFITGYTETDPTVPSWAKQPTKPSYTASEVGALPSSTTIPSKTSDLTNDSGFITGYTESDPTVPAWAKQPNKPTYTVSEISGLTDALDSKSNTGHTHDQYSLTGHTHTAQEVGALPSSTTIPSKTSDLTNDSGFITGYIETDPTVPAWAKAANKPSYTAAEVGALSSATTIPSKTSDLTNDSGFITGITTPVDSAITAYSSVTSVSATTSVSADTSTSATTSVSAETSVSATTSVSAVTSFSAETSNAVKHTDTGQLGGTVFPILASSSSNPNNGSHSVLYATNMNINPVTNSIAIGSGTTANGNYAFAEGYRNEATGNNSFAGGDECHALSSDTFAFGEGLRADYNNMFVVGRYNKDGESNGIADGVNWQHLFDVGYGMRHDVSNIQKETIFKVIGKWKYENYRHYIWSHVYFNDLNCNVIWADSYNHNNADYSEYLEWLDGNPNGEDRVGKFVTLKGNKIDIANADDDVIGVVSSTPGIIGNCSENNWHDKYLKDVYGRYIQPDGSDNQTVVVEGRNAYVLNPEYNSESEYVPRSKRKEWAVIGFIGQFIVDDDGTCVPGRRCVVTDGGIATLSPTNKVGYRVMERIDNTHIRIIASFL